MVDRTKKPEAATVPPPTSRYLKWAENSLVSVSDGSPASAPASFVHTQLRELIVGSEFPCLGARSALNRSTYRFGLYGPLGSPQAAKPLAEDLLRFVVEQPTLEGNFTTFIASFDGPNPQDEAHFEALLWKQLQALHDVDEFEWDAAVASDPDDPHFSFSFAGRAFFLVGLHAGSSRWARRFGWPTLVFNAHFQFEHMRARGNFQRFKAAVQSRDTSLQGSVNPSLTDYGALSEARQYAGRYVEPDWLCPIHIHRRTEK
jgi:uncharacterized protein